VTTIRGVEISRPDKLLFPDDGITKGEFVHYYADVADAMLPFARGHPVAMFRFPNGIDGQRFFQKQAPDYFPEFIRRVEIPKSKGTTNYPVCDTEEAIVYIASQACIEFHLLPTLADKLGFTDRMVFDLDPSIEDFDGVKRAAHLLRDLLAELGLPNYVMTSGSRGLHIWVPLRETEVEDVHGFANAAAEVLVSRGPDLLTTEFSKEARGDGIYVDVGRNAPAQHAVAPYSVRAKTGAPVATPLHWEEVADRKLGPQSYTLRTVRERMKGKDPWSDMRRHAKSLDKARRALDRLTATL
jgi:bifunctional non-homologous end joining protein LigD